MFIKNFMNGAPLGTSIVPNKCLTMPIEFRKRFQIVLRGHERNIRVE